MTPEDIINGLVTVLTAPLAQMNVILSPHEDEDDALELLALGPEKARLCLLAGDVAMAAAEVDQESGIARVSIRAIVQTPKDFQIKRAAGEITGSTAPVENVSLLRLSTWVRLLIQRVLFTARTDFDNEFGFRFLSDRRYSPDARRGLRSRELTFQCVISLDLPAGHPLEVPA
jgi:hypothetical protein